MIGRKVVFVKFCEEIVVVPDVVAPVIPAGIFAVQLMFAPGVDEVRLTCTVDVPEQIVWLGREKTTVGLGFTEIV